MTKSHESSGKNEKELKRIESELTRLRKLYNESDYPPKLEAISKQIDNLEKLQAEILETLEQSDKEQEYCDCCQRTLEELTKTKVPQLIENTAWLCGDCGVMYHSLWRVERSPRMPNVRLFLEEIKSNKWSPTGNKKFEELTKLARKNGGLSKKDKIGKEKEAGTKEDLPEHNCEEHKVSDGGGLDPRRPGKTWSTTYRCSICNAFLGTKTERLD